MRVLVTGGAGRLGRSVVDVLVSHNHEVVAVDLVPPGSVASAAGARSTSGLTAAGPARRPASASAAAWLTRDLTVAGEADRVVGEVRPEAVVHLAAIAVPFSRPEAEILRTNVMLAFDVCQAAVDHGVGVVVVASSPTVIGYGNPRGWEPAYLPINERHPVAPWHAYAVSKLTAEHIVASFARQVGERTRLAAIRPCYVVTPEEWAGAPTQAGHTIRQRLNDPALAAVSLFNYVDARDAAELVALLLVSGQADPPRRRRPDSPSSSPDQPDGTPAATGAWPDGLGAWPNGDVFFAGAADALARQPLAELLPRLVPATAPHASTLTGTTPAFDCAKADRLLGWKPQHSWRTELELAG